MNERVPKARVALVISVVLLMTSCQKEPRDPEWDVDVAVPLIRTTLTIGDLIGDTLIGTDGQGNVSIVYSARLFTLGLDTLMEIPDTSFRYRYPTDELQGLLPYPLVAGTDIPLPSDPIRFDLDELELREMRVRSGQLELAVTNRLNTMMFADILIARALLNGSSLQAQLSVPAGSTAFPSQITGSYPLDGYAFDLRGEDFDEVNTLAMDLDVSTDPGGGTVMLTMEDSLEVQVAYRDIKPRYVRGYFGQRDIDLEADSSELNVFDGISGLLDLEGSTAVLRIQNGIGVDARATIGYLHSVNRTTGMVTPLMHAITSTPLNLDRALDLGGSFQAATNAYTLNTSNSNIDAFIANLPDAIAYDIDVVTNPLGDVSSGNDFFYDDSELNADLDVNIPLRLIATDLTLSRETTVELDGTLEHHAFQYGTLHFFASNRFPFSAQVMLDIVTPEGSVLGTLSPGGTITSAPLGQNGLVTSAALTQLDFMMTKEQVDLFYPGSAGGPDGARLRIKVVFNTADQLEHVQLRSNYRIDIQASLEGNYIVNGDE